MKIRLFQSGGFVGKPKIAEEELASYPASLQQFVQQVFSQPPAAENVTQADKSRDKESYTLEFNGMRIPLQIIPANEELDKLVKKLKENLKYKKD